MGAYSGTYQASMDHVELSLVMLKTEVDIVDFAPTTVLENGHVEMNVILADLQLGGISLKSTRVRTRVGT